MLIESFESFNVFKPYNASTTKPNSFIWKGSYLNRQLILLVFNSKSLLCSDLAMR